MEPENNDGQGNGPAPLLGGGAPPAGEGDPRAWLPEAYRGNEMFAAFKGVEDLAKSYEHAARLVGVDKAQVLRLPKSEDAPEWANVWNALGRPEKPDAYDFGELPGELMDGVDAAAREAFHNAGLSGRQANAVMQLYAGQVLRAQEARAEQAAQIEMGIVNDLKREWGDGFQDKVHAANRAIMETGGAELAKVLQETQLSDGTYLGNHPALIRLFAKLGEQMAEPTALRGGAGGGGPSSYTPEAARAEIQRLMADRDFHAARRDKGHADHAKNNALWDRLHQVVAAAKGRGANE